MTDKEKQIEEMTWVLCKVYDKEHDVCNLDIDFGRCDRDCRFYHNAEMLYKAGYRKQSKGEWIPKDNFDGRYTIATCSECGTEKALPVLVRIETISSLYPYCQKCGAEMRKEDEGK